MSGAKARTRRTRSKTWSSLKGIDHKPSQYEIVTHDMNHTYKRDGTEPLEMGGNVHGNVWLRKHRDAHGFDVADWNDFRDPDAMTYTKYCEQQDHEETYIDGLLKDYTGQKDSDKDLSENTLDFLGHVMTPCRYLGHGQQMLAAYIQQMAHSSYVGHCATFQTADILRRVQRVAYRTKQLERAHPTRNFGNGELEIWEKHPDWQAFRKTVEESLITYDFDAAFVGFELVLKPLSDNILLKQFSIVAKSLGAELDAQIASNLYLDSERSQRWTTALVQFLLEQNESNRGTLHKLLDQVIQSGDSMISSGSKMLARYATSQTVLDFSNKDGKEQAEGADFDGEALSNVIRSKVTMDWKNMLEEAGLKLDF